MTARHAPAKQENFHAENNRGKDSQGPAIRLDGELARQDLMSQLASDLQNQTIDNGKNTASAKDTLDKELTPRIRKNPIEYLVLINRNPFTLYC